MEFPLIHAFLSGSYHLLELLLTMRTRDVCRTRNYVTRKCLPSHDMSAWTTLILHGDDSDFISLTSLSRDAFLRLAEKFRPHYLLVTGANPRRTGRRRHPVADPQTALGLCLVFYSSTMEMKTLCQVFGVPPSTCCRILQRAETALDRTLRRLEEAWIMWPTLEQQQEWASLVNKKNDLIHGRWGFIDGKNYPVQKPSGDDLQNALYNGWLHAHLVTGVLCFGCVVCLCLQFLVVLLNVLQFVCSVDGTIVWAKLNCPGSWNDGDMSRNFQLKLMDEAINLPDHGVLADSAFPVAGDLERRIMSPLKDGEIDRAPPDLVTGLAAMSAAITSLRQAAEWGMGAVSKVFRRLLLRLPFHQQRRAVRLANIHHLYNYRVRSTGISQIRSYFFE